MHYKTLALVAAALLLATLAPIPSALDTLVRIVACAVAAYGVVLAVGEGGIGWAVALGAVAVLFNPFYAVGFDPAVWMGLGVLAALVVGASAFRVGVYLDR